VNVHPYVTLGEGLPPAPILKAVITPPEWAHYQTQHEVDAFLDTGSGCTLLPLEILSILQLKIVQANVPINGIGGGQVFGFACYVNIWLSAFLFKAARAYGCPGIYLNQRMLVGRDLLNQCCVEFNGINSEFFFKVQ
jgi:hypothetical protein